MGIVNTLITYIEITVDQTVHYGNSDWGGLSITRYTNIYEILVYHL